MDNPFLPLLSRQKDYYHSGITRPYRFRVQQLKAFRNAIRKYEGSLMDALYADLNKSSHESYGTEIGPVLSEQRFIKNNLWEWMRPQSVPGMIFSFYSTGKILAEPYGS